MNFPKYSKADVLPVLNKVGSFLSVPALAGILSPSRKQLSLRSIMDKEQILLVNLAKGHLGADASALLGSLLLTAISSASFSRVDIPESERRKFIVYLDEFHNYTTGSLVNMFSELRKFGISFVIAHQYLHQLSNDIRNAVLGNMGTIICFTLGTDDARYMERVFYPVFKAIDFISLPHYSIYIKLLVRGATKKGFSARTITINDIEYARGYVGGG